jgi:type IV pilus assembly protein PilB
MDNSALYKSLIDLDIVEKDLIEDAYKLAKDTNENLGKILLERDLISDENLGMLMSDVLKVPYICLAKTVIDRNVLQLISEEMSRARLILAFKKDSEGIHIATSNPLESHVIEIVRRHFKVPVKIYYATERDILFALFSYHRDPFAIFEELIGRHTNEMEEGIVSEAPIIKIVDTMMVFAYQSRASDVHVVSVSR